MRTLDASFFQNGKAAKGLKPKRFSTTELEPGSVAYVASLTAIERDLCEVQWQKTRRTETSVGLRPFLVTWCLCDEQNKRMFDAGDDPLKLSESFAAAVKSVSGMPSRVISRAFDAATELNGFSESDVEELEKNLEATAGECGNGDMQPTPESAVASG